MPIIAIYALIAAALFGGGYGACWSHMTKQVAVLNAQIQLSNDDAKRKLLDAVTQTEAAEQAATVANISLETEHAKNVDINTHLSDSLAATRMYIYAKHTNSGCPTSKGGSTGESINTSTDRVELPNGLKNLLRSESKRADQLRAYVIECQAFVTSNCGIKHD